MSKNNKKEKTKNNKKNLLKKIIDMLKKLKINKKNEKKQIGGTYEKDFLNILKKKVGEKSIGELIYKNVKNSEVEELKKPLEKAQKEEPLSYKRVHYMTNALYILLKNNMDLKYPEYRKILVNKMEQLSKKNIEDYNEYKELKEELNERVDIDDVESDWVYENN